MDKEKEVNPDLYNRSYYLIDNEGCSQKGK